MDIELMKSRLGISDKVVQKHILVNNPNGYRTALKECIGEAIIKKFNVWERLFPDYQGFKKVSSTKLQKQGVDFIVTDANGDEIFIDLKADVGPDYGDIFPIEIYQNDIPTMVKSKKTDYLLHIIVDDNKIRAVLVDYQECCNVAHKEAASYCASKELPYPMLISNNGSGKYIKYDYLKNDAGLNIKVVELNR